MAVLRVRLLPEDRLVEVDVDECITVAELFRRLGVSREAAVAERGGEVLAEWDRVCGGDEVAVYLAVSGG